MASSLAKADKWTPSQVKAKADWEGGVVGLLEYGLKSSGIDDSTPEGAELKATWRELDGFSDVLYIIEKLLEKAPDLEDDDR